MTLGCPECGTPAPAGTPPGRAYACPRCRNPVLAVDRPPPSAPTGAPAAAEPPAGDAAPRFPWLLAVVAFVVLGAAYVGAYELLSAEAKRERASLERVHGAAALAAFPAPGPVPEASDAAALRAWQTARDRHADRVRHEQLGRRVDLYFFSMMGAFVAQTVLTAVLALRSRSRSKAPAAPRPRAR